MDGIMHNHRRIGLFLAPDSSLAGRQFTLSLTVDLTRMSGNRVGGENWVDNGGYGKPPIRPTNRSTRGGPSSPRGFPETVAWQPDRDEKLSRDRNPKRSTCM